MGGWVGGWVRGWVGAWVSELFLSFPFPSTPLPLRLINDVLKKNMKEHVLSTQYGKVGG